MDKCLVCFGTGKKLYHDGLGNCMFCGGTGETDYTHDSTPRYTTVHDLRHYTIMLEKRIKELEDKVESMNLALYNINFR